MYNSKICMKISYKSIEQIFYHHCVMNMTGV